MNDHVLLDVKELRKYYKVKSSGWVRRKTALVKAVDRVSLTVKRSETFGLVGESGCGKTTFGRCVLRLEAPTSGQVRFNDVNVMTSQSHRLRQLRQKMQIIFQDPYSSLDPRHTIGRIIGEPLRVHRSLPSNQITARIGELLEVVGLHAESAHRYPHEFSGGQRQRVCIARALALNPELIIADEPVSALDVSIQAQILNLLVDLQERYGLTYIFISHDLSVVRHIADRVAVMYLGRIVESAPSGELYAHPRHPYTHALLSAVPVANPQKKSDEVVLEGDLPSPLDTPSGCSFHPRCPRKGEKCDRITPELQTIAGEQVVACHYPLVN
ncbi:MAG: dipeptide ABC transporter ATP-binding protein [Desulfobacterales bacterium]|jgi:peptide/nickel transport system ATP-binding protein/oligopeptide transport system ATP-binding protein